MFRSICKKYIEPLSIVIMMSGIFFICQPWSMYLHQKGLLITILGFLSFLVFSRIQPVETEKEEEVTEEEYY